MMPQFAYICPSTLEEAIQHLCSPAASIHAGGTDLLGCLRDRVFHTEKVVSISRIGALRGIRKTPQGGLGIGALTTITEVSRHEMIRGRYRALAQAASEVASPQLRNQGTLGGNICQKPRCWYYRGEFHCLRKGGDQCFAVDGENQFHCIFGGDMCFIVHPSDTAPALVAFEASVRIAGPTGTRTVPAEQFFVSPSQNLEKETVLDRGEIVTEVILPRHPPVLRSSYRKVRARRSWDFALAGVALALTFQEDRVVTARVVLSGAAPVPWRSHDVEAVITGKRLEGKTISQAAKAAVQNARPLAQNGYKIPLFEAIIEEELLAMAEH
jgi:xanthine dehydrogenase YagS FAD-binding subunit